MKISFKKNNCKEYYINEFDLLLKVDSKVYLFKNDKLIFSDEVEDIFSYEIKYNYLLYGKDNNVYVYDFNKMQIIDVIYNTKIEDISLKGNGLIDINGRLDYIKGANINLILDYISDINEYYFYENYDIVIKDFTLKVFENRREIKELRFEQDVFFEKNLYDIRFFKNLIVININENETVIIDTKRREIFHYFELFNVLKYKDNKILLFNDISLILYDIIKKKVVKSYIIRNDLNKSYINKKYFLIYGNINSLESDTNYNILNLDNFEFEETDFYIHLGRDKKICSFDYNKIRNELILYIT